MSEVRRWAHTVEWEGLQISATYMAINDRGEYVMHDDYATLEAELAKLHAGQEPDGWKLVPVEPTLEMLDAAIQDGICVDGKPVWKRDVVFQAKWRYQQMLSAAPATVHGAGWIPVSERLPESERTVLAFYLNSHGKGRRVRAEYIAAKTKSADDGWDSDEPADYDEQADEYFWPAGWYEVMDNWDCLTHMVIHEGEVTHWMPLPESPAIAAARNEGGKV